MQLKTKMMIYTSRPNNYINKKQSRQLPVRLCEDTYTDLNKIVESNNLKSLSALIRAIVEERLTEMAQK